MAICEVRNPSTTTKKYEDEETVVDERRITELLASCAVTTCSTLHLAGEAMEPTSIYYSIHYTRPLHEKRLTLISSHRKMSYIRSRRHNSKMFVYNILYAYALRPVVQ